MPRARRAALAAAVAAYCAGAARAHDVETLEPVVVTGPSSGPGTTEAASEGSASGAELQARPPYRPGELLEAVPGMIVTQHSGEGKANQYFLRGFNLDHGTDFAITVDGMPVNQRTHAHGQGYADLNFVIPELVSRLDYRKGPYFADEGDFSSAGAAHLRLPDRLERNTALLSAGSFGYRRGLLAGSPAAERGNWLYALDYLQNDGPWQRPDDLRRLSGVLRYAHGTPGHGWSVTAMAYRNRWSATDQIPRRAVASGALDRFGTLDPSDGGRSSRYSLSGQWRHPTEWGFAQANAYVIASRLNLYSNFTYFLDDPVAGDQFEQSDRRMTTGGNFAHTFVGALGKRSMENTLGLQLRSDRIRVGLFGTRERDRLGTVRDDRVIETSTGVYLHNRVEWTDWLRTTAGLRGDQFIGRVTSDNADNSGRAAGYKSSPKAGIVLGPWGATELFANWGRGFHSNDARGATITVDPKVPATAVARVPLLVASRGEEIGVRTQTAAWNASIALFRLDFDSELVFVGDAGTTEASRPSRRDGVELTVRYQPTTWFALDFEWAETRARFKDADAAGNRIPGAPNRVVTAGVTVPSLGDWYGTLQLRHFGPRPLNEDASVQSRSSTLLSGKIGYRVRKGLRLQLDGFNLANAKVSQIDYFYASRLRSEAAGVSDVHFHPVEPRSARVALIADF